MKRIGIDLDGTIADNLGLLVETLNNYCGQKFLCEEIPRYNLCEVYNISEQEFINLMMQKEPEIISNCTVIFQADKYITQLANDGWVIHIITARNPQYRDITEKWLVENKIPFHGLHLLNSHDKLAKCRELNLTLMVEDNIHNAYQLSSGGVATILYTAPHNRAWPWDGVRCQTWEDVYLTASCT